jgi:hypothetical protein
MLELTRKKNESIIIDGIVLTHQLSMSTGVMNGYLSYREPGISLLITSTWETLYK